MYIFNLKYCVHNNWYLCKFNGQIQPLKYIIVDGTGDGLGVFPMWEDIKGNVYDPDKEVVYWFYDGWLDIHDVKPNSDTKILTILNNEIILVYVGHDMDEDEYYFIDIHQDIQIEPLQIKQWRYLPNI